MRDGIFGHMPAQALLVLIAAANFGEDLITGVRLLGIGSFKFALLYLALAAAAIIYAMQVSESPAAR
jgi:hypothetical protein